MAVCRELTKRFEEVVRGSAAELAERFAEPPKGEITLVLGPARAGDGRVTRGRALAAVAELVAAGTRGGWRPRSSPGSPARRNGLYRGNLCDTL